MASLSNMQLVAETISGTVNLPAATFDAHAGTPVTEAFGGGFRSWYFGQYNGINAADPIDESQLRLPADENDDAVNNFVQMIPFSGDGQWRIQDPDCWISADQMSATRFGRKNLTTALGLDGGRAVVRMGGAANEGASVQVPFVGGSGSSGTNWSTVNYLDFNGDGYPDVVGNGKVQSTLPNGALAAAPATVDGCQGGSSKSALQQEREPERQHGRLGFPPDQQLGGKTAGHLLRQSFRQYQRRAGGRLRRLPGPVGPGGHQRRRPARPGAPGQPLSGPAGYSGAAQPRLPLRGRAGVGLPRHRVHRPPARRPRTR